MAKKQDMEPEDFMMKYLEEKFKLVHLRLDSLDTKSDSVEKTIKDLTTTIERMKIVEGKHFLTCPNTIELKALSLRVDEFSFFKKYWKPFLLSGVLSITVALFSAYKSFYETKDIIHKEAVSIKQEDIDAINAKFEAFKKSIESQNKNK